IYRTGLAQFVQRTSKIVPTASLLRSMPGGWPGVRRDVIERTAPYRGRMDGTLRLLSRRQQTKRNGPGPG
ncbi:MAG: hypothetical protein WBP63_19380, partial [Silvibacterium sp.]